ncbi:hypothetical protein [Microlunatus soli]
MVLIKDLADRRVVPGFSTDSRKDRDVVANPHAALDFYRRERAQQITISGSISEADAATSDALFADRRSRPLPPSAALPRNDDRSDVDTLQS